MRTWSASIKCESEPRLDAKTTPQGVIIQREFTLTAFGRRSAIGPRRRQLIRAKSPKPRWLIRWATKSRLHIGVGICSKSGGI